MSENYIWDKVPKGASIQQCRSDATTWAELVPALVASWVRFIEILATEVPVELQSHIVVNFFTSSGRVTWGHQSHPYPVEAFQWENIPTDYRRTVSCSCDWLESQWYAATDIGDEEMDVLLAQLGIQFASVCLGAASNSSVVTAFRVSHPDTHIVVGQGVTQSPARFEIPIEQLLSGRLPPLLP